MELRPGSEVGEERQTVGFVLRRVVLFYNTFICRRLFVHIGILSVFVVLDAGQLSERTSCIF